MWINIQAGEVSFEEWIEKLNEVAGTLGLLISKGICGQVPPRCIQIVDTNNKRIRLNMPSEASDVSLGMVPPVVRPFIFDESRLETKTEAIAFLIFQLQRYYRDWYLFNFGEKIFWAKYRFTNDYEDPDEFEQSVTIDMS